MLSAYLKRNSSSDGKKKDLTAHYELRDCPIPSLNVKDYPPNTILVRTIAASICGSDLFGLGGCPSYPVQQQLKDYLGGCPSCPEWRRPTALFDAMPEKCGGSGHEAIGIIVDMVPPSSSTSREMSIGQKVLAMSTMYMYKVDSVRKVIEKETGRDISSAYPEQCGAFAEYFISHVSTCVKLPDSIPSLDFDPRWYVLAQPLGTILHACQKLGSVVNTNVAVVGQGQNGLIMTQMLANMGARRIIALDLLDERLSYSLKNKATHTIKVTTPMDIDGIKQQVKNINEGKLCDVTIEMVGHQSNSIQLCSKLTRDGGKVLLFGLPPDKSESQMSIGYEDLVRNLTYVCSHSPQMESFELAVELIARGVFDPSTIFSHTIPFSRFVDAYQMANNYEDGVVKILLSMEEH
jgi:threonine dehydrogenase-like Zn-dependent dehydrogenase